MILGSWVLSFGLIVLGYMTLSVGIGFLLLGIGLIKLVLTCLATIYYIAPPF
jgi:hypothetical protein